MWNKITSAYRQFAHDKAGERFLNAHERWKGGSGLMTTVILVIAAAILIVMGLLLGLIPGVPGIVLGLLGAVLIATRFRKVAVWMDRTEVKCRKLMERWRLRFAHP